MCAGSRPLKILKMEMTKQTKILLFISSLHGGGAERVCANLANYWASVGQEVVLVTLSLPESDAFHLHPAVKRIPLGLLSESNGLREKLVNNWKRIFALHRVISDVKPDLAIAMMSSGNILLGLTVLLGNRKVVRYGREQIHPPCLPLGKEWEILRKLSYFLLDGVVALTEKSKIWIKQNTLAKNIFVIPNPLVYPIPTNEPVIPPASVGALSRKRVLAVGRLAHQKGFDLLLQAFHQVAKSYPDWELVILGEGELRSELEQRITNLGLSEQVFLPGRVGNVGDWYASADIFVLSSRFEGFPNTLLEAMASGVAVVSFDCETGPRDIIRHGRNGLLVNAEDVQGLAEAMAKLMGDENLRKQLSENANSSAR
ncbi:MAG: glycosyl transferase [Patescibacteria group bacterium]|nr:MAG: glycosyl transferase [Patescibacteria group bacterium]